MSRNIHGQWDFRAARLLSWRHTGFTVRNEVKASTKEEAWPVGKHMVRQFLSQEQQNAEATQARSFRPLKRRKKSSEARV